MNVILSYNNKADLKNKIISAYLKEIKKEEEMCTRILSDKNWASTGSHFHNKCRSDLTLRAEEASKQIKMLTPKEQDALFDIASPSAQEKSILQADKRPFPITE